HCFETTDLRSEAREPPCIEPRSLHDALPISLVQGDVPGGLFGIADGGLGEGVVVATGIEGGGKLLFQAEFDVDGDGCVMGRGPRSEEHTSELQSRENLVCRLLLEKKKQGNIY